MPLSKDRHQRQDPAAGLFQTGTLQVPDSSLSFWQVEALQRLTAAEPILVTDDDRMSRLFYRALLDQEFGFGLMETPDPAEALRICQERPISLVISCLLKPTGMDMDGLTLVEMLKQDLDTRQIPLLVISASMNAQEIALHAGADAFLSKPCHPNQILHEVWMQLRPRLL